MKGIPKITVDMLKLAYPNPVRCNASTLAYEGPYCVLGALAQWYGVPLEDGFPSSGDSEIVLMRANPEISFWDAEGFSTSILDSNDKGDFEAAWNKLDEALNWISEE